jgi:hypothetical protein
MLVYLKPNMYVFFLFIYLSYTDNAATLVSSCFLYY